MEEEVLDKYKVEDNKRERFPVGVEACAQKQETQQKSGEKIAGQDSSPCSESITCSVCTASRTSQRKGEEMKQQQRMKIMKILGEGKD